MDFVDPFRRHGIGRILRGGGIEYQDFVVQIGPGRGMGVAIRVIAAPAGEGEALFYLPSCFDEWQSDPLGTLLRRDSLHGPPSPALPTANQLGETLFRALFTGRVGMLFAASRGSVLQSEEGLRLRLHFCLQPDDPWSALLHSLPWELLCDPDTRDFLALSRRTPLVRSFEIPRPIPPLELSGRLRILVALADGPGEALDLERERQLLEEACSQVPAIEILDLEGHGITELRKTLLNVPIHILHIMGHAVLDPVAKRGFLSFAGTNGSRVAVSGETLANVLKDFPNLRLVFLNACNTGRMPAGIELDPFAGVAAALVLGGVPAVLAMQLVVADDIAITFSQAVYSRLTMGDPLDAAVSEGRQAIHALHPESAEWAIPILFTRMSDGRIFLPHPAATSTAINDGEPEVQAAPRGQVQKARRRFTAWALALLAVAFLTLAARWVASYPVPPQRVRLAEFSIARHEVSLREFLRFVEAKPEWRRDRIRREFHDGEYLAEWSSPSSYPPGLDDHPVTHVSWYAARAYCQWLGGDLPTQKEWKRAANSGEFSYPWGARGLSGSALLNFCDRSCAGKVRSVNAALPGLNDLYPGTAPVTAFPAGRTREGVSNLSGNVWEWTLDESGPERVNMGGSFASSFEECSTDRPSWEPARLCARDGGFRCVWH